MQPKRTSKELIQESLIELMESRPFDKISVRDIVKECGITTRTFYNHFRDKCDVVASVYIDTVSPHLMNSLENWHEMKSRIIMDRLSFYSSAFAYSGQNNLGALLANFDCQKYLLHTKPEVRQNPTEMSILEAGITFLISGQFGLMAYTSLDTPLIAQSDYAAYGSYENLLEEWMPPIVKRNLLPLPQCEDAYWDPSTEKVVVTAWP